MPMNISKDLGRMSIVLNPIRTIIRRILRMKRFLLVLLILIAVLGAVGSVYFYQRYSALKSNPNAEAQEKSESLIAALSSHMQLPQDEVPSVVTIVDKTKLNDQPFFKMAENGDILFAYINSKQAILYRPATDRIIQVAAINVGTDAPISTADPVTSSGLTIAYQNGTTTAGLSLEAEKLVNAEFENFTTALLSSAIRTDYAATIVIDISGKHAKEATNVARLLNGTVSELPEGEVAPNADLLVILGR